MLQSGWMDLSVFMEWLEAARPRVLQFFERGADGEDWIPLDADEQLRLPRQQWAHVLTGGGPVRVCWWPSLQEVHVMLG